MRQKIDKKLLQKVLRNLHPEEYEQSDKGNGQLFSDVYRDSLRFNATEREWFYYDGSRWLQDTGGMYAEQKAKELTDALLSYTIEMPDKDKDKYRQYVAKLGSRHVRRTMIDDSRDYNFITDEDLDKDLYLLNVQNGTLDLRTFELLPHNPEQLISKICNVEYNPDASCDQWQKFITEIMQGDNDKIRYLQKILGLSLTGDTKEECCWLLYGATTRNGKSTLVETFGYMLGGTDGYSCNMKPETLAQKQNNDSRQASGDIARLDGCRFLNASEPPRRMIFDSALLKTLLGRDTITARRLHQSEFQFTPVFKLCINTNFLPLITDETLFTSGRLYVIPFDRHFTPEEQDKGLKDRLKEPDNLSGLLNWCLDGLKAYYNEGLLPPQCVIDATEEYRQASDKVGCFITDCLEESKENSTLKEVYETYSEWCRDNGFGVENKSNFKAEMESKGLFKAQGTVRGTTCRNIIVGYIVNEFCAIPDNAETPFDY